MRAEESVHKSKLSQLDSLAEDARLRMVELAASMEAGALKKKKRRKGKKGKKAQPTMASILAVLGSEEMASKAGAKLASSASAGAGAGTSEGGREGGRSASVPPTATRVGAPTGFREVVAVHHGAGSQPEAVGDEADEDEDDGSEDGDTVNSSLEGGGSSDEDSGLDTGDRDTIGTLGTISSRRPVRVRAGDDAESIATSIISSASSIRSTHSKKSLTVLIERHMQREKERIAAAVARGDTDDFNPAMPGIAPPRIVVNDETRGALDGKRALVNLLPYQRRNPAA